MFQIRVIDRVRHLPVAGDIQIQREGQRSGADEHGFKWIHEQVSAGIRHQPVIWVDEHIRILDLDRFVARDIHRDIPQAFQAVAHDAVPHHFAQQRAVG